MRYLLYGFIRMIEATLFYILAFFLLRQLDTHIPPIGSQAFIIFVLVWPVIGTIVRPGLLTIPIIGDIFTLFDTIARALLGEQKSEGKKNTTKIDATNQSEPQKQNKKEGIE